MLAHAGPTLDQHRVNVCCLLDDSAYVLCSPVTVSLRGFWLRAVLREREASSGVYSLDVSVSRSEESCRSAATTIDSDAVLPFSSLWCIQTSYRVAATTTAISTEKIHLSQQSVLMSNPLHATVNIFHLFQAEIANTISTKYLYFKY